MADFDTGYLSKHEKFRIDRKKLALLFCVLAVIAALIVFWWLKLVGITVTGEAFCNLEEHTHSNDCYVSEIICGVGENGITETPVTEETFSEKENADDCNGTNESVTDDSTQVEEVTADETSTVKVSEAASEYSTTELSHIHTDECYKYTLICQKTPHTHTSECFSDKSSDCETVSDWISTFEDITITDSVPENLLAIAKTQVGYEESGKNYEYDSEGNKKGYTRYGEWYGSPYGNWNAMFISFCLNYSNMQENEVLFSSNAVTMYQHWKTQELFEEAEEHEAKVGELLFLDIDSDEIIDHVSVISEITDSELRVIIGDLNNRVEEIVIEDSEAIIGYGLTYNLKVPEEETAEIEESTPQETTEAVETTTTDESTSVTETTVQATTENANTEETTSQEVSVKPTYESEEEYSEALGDDLLSGLEDLSEEDRSLIIKMHYINSLLPALDEFYAELDRLYELEDMQAEEDYINTVHNKFAYAYCLYQCLDDLQKYFTETEKLFNLKEFFGNFPQTYVSSQTNQIGFNFINYKWYSANNGSWDDTLITPIIVHGGSVSETVNDAVNRFWWGFVVEYNSAYDYYYVDRIYSPEGNTSTSNSEILSLESETGFVILIWSADNGTTQQKASAAIASTVELNDRVNISMDPTTVSSGYKSSGYGTISFDVPFVEPEPDDPDTPSGTPVVEDIPVSDICDGELSDTQVKDAGGITTSAEGDVEISKSIDGTDIENVFDITLTVRTESSMQTYLADPDMAVVIVMDISNTMNTKYPAGSSTSRYDAAVVAAENFINQFAQKGQGISKLGFVAFNTHAHEILTLQTCTTANKDALISEMKSDTGAIINNYVSGDRTRFTNVEGGLKMGYDMLNATDNENKYIIFLSDGFPTTYLINNSSNNTTSFYEGYDPYTSSGTKGADGVFYDYVTEYYCSYGTSYSDKASIKARVMATNIKNAGAKIFSIGIDVGGQTIEGYDGRSGLSVIDRTSTTYEIGDASSTAAYQNWLRNSIGSGYYYDSTNQTEISAAFNSIFAEIENLNKESRETIWTTTDPLPVLGEDASVVEFINFFDKDGKAVYYVDKTEGFEYLDGEFGVGLENTAFHKNQTIYWDLKDSGYTTESSADGNTTYFYYKIKYRIRLYNENAHFVEYTTYNTNGDAFLEYKTITTINDETTVSDNKSLYFEKPAVEGYYEEFAFYKQSDLGDPLEGAVFTLSHDDEACSVCHGNGKPVTSVSTLGPFTSTADGSVSFPRIPSGHIYTLKETKVPDGFVESEQIYKVTVALDELSIRIYESEDDTVGTLWSGDENFVFINEHYVYLLPETGGAGTLHLTIIGYSLMLFPVFCMVIRRKRKRSTEKTSL